MSGWGALSAGRPGRHECPRHGTARPGRCFNAYIPSPFEDPDAGLSTDPVRAIQERLPPSIEAGEFPRAGGGALGRRPTSAAHTARALSGDVRDPGLRRSRAAPTDPGPLPCLPCSLPRRTGTGACRFLPCSRNLPRKAAPAPTPSSCAEGRPWAPRCKLWPAHSGARRSESGEGSVVKAPK